MSNILELGGFAEYEEEIDGAFEAFNYCLAMDYVSAMYNEDFERLGSFSVDLLEKISYWINYDGRDKKTSDDIVNGTLITIKNRTFIDAILANRNGSLAETYLSSEIYSAKLVLSVILAAPTEEDEDFVVYIGDSNFTQEDYDKLFVELYDLIEEEFESVNNKIEYLNTIRNNFGRIRVYKNCRKKGASDKYEWVKMIKKSNI